MDSLEIDARLLREYPLMFLEMNAAQERFIRIKNRFGRTPKRRIFEAGNKVGKCITYSTLIETPNGEVSIGSLFETGKPFDVYAWDGNKRVVARASAPFKKGGLHRCYQIGMSDGRWVEAADLHRVFCCDGEYRTVSTIADSFPVYSPHISFYEGQPLLWCWLKYAILLVSSLGLSLLARFLGGQSSLRKGLGYRGDCFEYPRLCGGQPRWGIDSGQVFPPLSACVPQHSVVLSGVGGLGNRCTNTHQQVSAHLSSLYDLPRRVGRFVVSLVQAAYTFFQWYLHEHLTPRQPCVAEGVPLRSYDGWSQSYFGGCQRNDTEIFSSVFVPPLYVDNNHIISIKPIKSQEVYDFTVEKYHNYFAGGLIHHNSEIGIAEDIAYSVGYRAWLPPDDPDHRVNVKVPNIGLIACETMMHSVAEKIEPTLRKLIPKTCQPVFKPGSAGILTKVTLPYGCYGEKCGSTIYIRSYDQRADSFEGIDYDGYIHWDEPPPPDMFRAVERGKVVANSDSWFTMTPLKQAWLYDMFSSRAATVI